MKSMTSLPGQNLQKLTYNMLAINTQQMVMQRVVYGCNGYVFEIKKDIKIHIIKSLAKYLNFKIDSQNIESIIDRNYQITDPTLLIIINYLETMEMVYYYNEFNLPTIDLILGFQQKICGINNSTVRAELERKNHYIDAQNRFRGIYGRQTGPNEQKIQNIFTIHRTLSHYYGMQGGFIHKDLCLMLLLRALLVQNNYQFTHMVDFEDKIAEIVSTCKERIAQGQVPDDNTDMQSLPEINSLLQQILYAYQQGIDHVKNFGERLKNYRQKIKDTIRKLYKRFTITDIYIMHKEIDPRIINQILLKESDAGSLRSEIINNSINYFHIDRNKNFVWGQKLKKVQEVILQQKNKFTFQNIIDLCPNVSAVSIRKTLAKCSELNLITCTQKGRYAHWIRKMPNNQK